MFQRIRRFFMSNIRNRLMLAMLVVSLPPLVGTMAYGVYATRNLVYEYTLSEQEHRVHTLALGVDRFLSGARQDVLFLSQSEEIVALLQAKANNNVAAYQEARQTLEREFLAFSQVREIYYQVRYLDATGMEIARVDSNGSRSLIVPRDQLQNKSGRYYFDDTIVLPQGEMMVSPLDLNVERGEIEVPFKPVIRYATPVWSEGQAAGIIIVNIFADRFLNELEAKKETSEIIVLVDQDGYYLHHSDDKEKQWGRDLETGITLDQDYTQAATRIFSAEHESELIENEFLTYTAFSPPGTTAYQWALISLRPRQVVLAPLLQFERITLGVLIVAAFVIVMMGKWSSDFFAHMAQQLEALATGMERGDLETEITMPASYPNEVTALARAFDQARISLHQIHLDLEKQATRSERHALQLHTAAQVSHAAAGILDLQELLSHVVVLISEQFGFYHAGVFLIDNVGEWATLQAASSPGGQRMLAHGHRLRVGGSGIVGYVTETGNPRIALDVGVDVMHSVNPNLSETQSEMALPLQARGQVLGALEIQSTAKQAFTDEDVQVLQTVADQVAMAISNVRLFQQSQERAEALQRAAGDYSYTAWTEMARAQTGLGYRYNQQVVSPAKDFWEPEMTIAIQKGDIVKYSTDSDSSGGVAIPIRFRDRVIGVINAHKPRDTEGWTAEEIELLEALADQLSIALESARLYQDTQRHAAREQLMREITDEMRRNVDVEAVLRSAVTSLGQALGAPRTFVRLTIDEERPMASVSPENGGANQHQEPAPSPSKEPALSPSKEPALSPSKGDERNES